MTVDTLHEVDTSSAVGTQNYGAKHFSQNTVYLTGFSTEYIICFSLLMYTISFCSTDGINNSIQSHFVQENFFEKI